MSKLISPLINTDVELLNPLPGGVTKEDVLRLANVFDPKASTAPAFQIEYIWQGAGVHGDGRIERGELTFNPGNSHKMPEEVADVVLKTIGSLGIVKVRATDDVRKKKLEGLHKAREHYNLHGMTGYQKFQNRNDYSEEQMQRNRKPIQPYLINIEKEKLIQAEIDRLEKDYFADKRKVKE